jgi:hypothetical protein
MTPNRFDLQSIEKIHNESIKEHVLKWHGVTIWINPFLLEKDIISIFINTFKSSYILIPDLYFLNIFCRCGDCSKNDWAKLKIRKDQKFIGKDEHHAKWHIKNGS